MWIPFDGGEVTQVNKETWKSFLAIRNLWTSGVRTTSRVEKWRFQSSRQPCQFLTLRCDAV
jgi:hypothetical protein